MVSATIVNALLVVSCVSVADLALGMGITRLRILLHHLVILRMNEFL